MVVGGRTGSMVRQRTALVDPSLRRLVPLLAQALPHVGHYQTRNRGTLGGSIAHADPSAEIPLALATLGGEVELKSRQRTRKLPAEKFFLSALTTARAPDEILTAVHWPSIGTSARTAFAEFAVREGDFAIVAVACVADTKSRTLRLGFGGCGEKPQVVEKRNVDATAIGDVVEDATKSLDCRGDLLASVAYRRQLAGVLARRVVRSALQTEPADV